jgi:dihydropteroate synthase
MLHDDHIIHKITLNRNYPLLMGILNVTPDSFFDGFKYYNFSDAIIHARKLIKDGADIIDIGGESSRPGSISISADEECNRIVPVIMEIRRFSSIPISVDTRKAKVAEEAIRAGANIINDVSSGKHDDSMSALIASEKHICYIIMHMQGEPQTMQEHPHYDDVVYEISEYFTNRICHFSDKGVERERLLIDPGIGFGKTTEHNLLILKNLQKFSAFGLPIVIGASRKRFINCIYPSEPDERLSGSLAVAGIAMSNGASVLRVHDVFEHLQYFRIKQAISQVEIE